MAEPISTEEAVRLYRNYKAWPAKPFLPLVHNKRKLLGLIIRGNGTTVYLSNLAYAYAEFHASGGKVKSPTFKRWLNTQSWLNYETFEDVLADGWTVD